MRFSTLQVVLGMAAATLYVAPAFAVQQMAPLSTINPGTEHVTLVPNGDFESAGPNPELDHPFPTDWNRVNDMFDHTPPINPAANNADGLFAATAHIDGGAGVGLYYQGLSGLLPNTEYVLSAYIWNFGNASHHVNANVDLNDAGPIRLVLQNDTVNPGADHGYFVYDTFNTLTTGTSPLLRVFYDNRVGDNNFPAPYFPNAAQWDNIGVTLASDFRAPQSALPVPEPAFYQLGGLLSLGALGYIKRRRSL